MMDIDYLLIILPSIILLGIFGLILVIWQYGNSSKKEKNKQTTIVDVKRISKTTIHRTFAELTSNKSCLKPSDRLTAEVSEKQSKLNAKGTFFILQLLAAAQRPYKGYELIQTLSSHGFHYGEMNIFHYYADQNEKNQRLFSLASALEPGTFDLTHIGEIHCPGLCLFMPLNETNHALNTFELMLEIAQLLIQDLGGTLCDQQREPLTAKTLDCFRNSEM
jgi:cell division protein ZipA